MAHGGCTNSKKLLFTRLFGFAVGAWASTGDNWASPLRFAEVAAARPTGGLAAALASGAGGGA